MSNDTQSEEGDTEENQNKCDQRDRKWITDTSLAHLRHPLLTMCRKYWHFSTVVGSTSISHSQFFVHVSWAWLRRCYCWHSLWQHRIKYKNFFLMRNRMLFLFIFGLQPNKRERIIQIIRSSTEFRRIIFSWYLKTKIEIIPMNV